MKEAYRLCGAGNVVVFVADNQPPLTSCASSACRRIYLVDRESGGTVTVDENMLEFIYQKLHQ